MKNLLKNDGKIVCLIKPQFEAGRELVGKKGVVRDINVHKDVIHMVLRFAVSVGFNVLNLDFSPIKGPEGNIEYLACLQKTMDETGVIDAGIDVDKTVELSHKSCKQLRPAWR